ncbi:cardiolipin synthase [Candidatus Saccharibacteria bacterium]|nr:cardiolipin synthase [Candidatus Saccharibacteria bacterium]
MKRLLRKLSVVLVALFLEGLVLLVLSSLVSSHAAILEAIVSLIAVFFALTIVDAHGETAYETLWLLLILIFPLPGLILYWLFSKKSILNPLGDQLANSRKNMPDLCDNRFERYATLEKQNLRLAETFRYIENKTGFPTLPAESTDYFSLGEEMYARMLEDLKSAKKYIFVEYFILNHGSMLDSILEILEQKAKAGVDVRILYDDLGSLSTFSENDAAILRKKGIKCHAFNPILLIRGTINNRDHRKILIIDGEIAYSGGINLADEYINKKMRFKHWKDIGFRIDGAPVKNYVKMFVEFWNAYTPSRARLSPLDYLSPTRDVAPVKNGFILSYYDSPFTEASISNNLYIELLSQATKYAWFYTPYLMFGDSLMSAFVRAAERGIDVRIFMPGVPDKKLVYRMGRSFYPALLKAGVKIYEYSPGFLHAKASVVDGKVATIGSVNLDYRSLFLHFENNTIFYKTNLIKDLVKDFKETQKLSVERTENNLKFSRPQKILNILLRLFAPLC